jgi:hypothetical protein
MTPTDIIAEVRSLVNDSVAPYRYADSLLLGFVNQTLRRMAMMRPDLFLKVANVTTAPGAATQSLPTDAIRLVEVYRTVGGDVLTETNKDALDQTYPGWRSETPGLPVNYMRHVRNPKLFFLYPAPVEGVELEVEYSAAPPTYALGATIDILSSAYMPVIIDGVVYLVASIDDEHIGAGRAKMFSESFTAALRGDMQMHQLTDTDAGSLNPKQVV